MLAITIDGYSLVALIVIVAALLIVVVVAARLARRDQRIRISRVGVFVERERFDEEDDQPPEHGWSSPRD